MPKSKVRKKTDYSSAHAGRTPLRVKGGPSPVWYKVLMFGFMLAGLAWLATYYIAAKNIGWLDDLGGWNFLIGFGLMVVGLVMTMGWS
jgi:hypothetical protein